jgi:Ca2+-transporting ATPase
MGNGPGMSLQLPPTPHALPPDELIRLLEVDPEAGLDLEEVQRRRDRFGPNELSAAEPVSPWRILIRQFQDLMVAILLAAAAISLGAWSLEGAEGLPADTLVIAAIVVLNAALGFAQEFRAEKTIEELRRMASVRSRVRRAGQETSVLREELVPGDLVLLEEGDRVPADLVLLSARRLRADESMLTGESVPVSKRPGPVPAESPVDSRTCCVFAGSTLTAGQGRGVVVGTGSATELGGIATSLASTTPPPTPLQQRLDQLGRQIGLGVLILSVLIGLTLLAVEGRMSMGVLLRVLMFAVALAVAAVPEGLPAVLTISLSVGARRLARRRAVVRRMAAVETLGSVTTIVTDKTGTLTHNQMTVQRVWFDGQELEVTGRGCEVSGEILGSPVLEGGWKALLAAGCLASTADLQETPGQPRRALGDPTEAALLVLADKAGLDWRTLRLDQPELALAPFSSERARMSSLRQGPGGAYLYLKGSPEQVLARSTAIWSRGRAVPLPPSEREALLEAETRLADQGLRTLALAFRRVEVWEGENPAAEDFEQDLVFLGMAAMHDPAREAVPAAMRRCRDAGIRVLMLTGDHPRTARTIARSVGLLEQDSSAPGPQVLTGAEIARMSDEELDVVLFSCRVFARVSPQAKLRLVERLLARGEVVAMTGDGVNDAPALKKVHVGMAMGSGTAVAIEASEVVLLDDDFATIVTAIEGGRGVFTNVQKFIAFLFSGNLGVVLAMFAGTIMAGIYSLMDHRGILLPLTAGQILWMNLVTDGAPAVAFSLSGTRPGMLEEPPRRPDSPILSPDLWRFLGVTGGWVAILLLVVLDGLYSGGVVTLPGSWDLSGAGTWADPDRARSAAFYVVVTARLFNAMNFQPLPGPLFCREAWRDRYVPAACLVSWALTMMLLGWEPLRRLFSLVPLTPVELVVLTALASTILLVGEGWKHLVGVRLAASSGETSTPMTKSEEATTED